MSIDSLKAYLHKLSPAAKGVLLIISGYVVTVGAAIFTSIALMILMQPHNCTDFGRALLVLWGTIAALFLASVAVVGIIAWKIIPGIVGRLAIIAAHGMAMLGSYIVIAFGLMVLFNC